MERTVASAVAFGMLNGPIAPFFSLYLNVCCVSVVRYGNAAVAAKFLKCSARVGRFVAHGN